MAENIGSRITRFLGKTHPAAFSAYAIVAAFGTYFCRYGTIPAPRRYNHR